MPFNKMWSKLFKRNNSNGADTSSSSESITSSSSHGNLNASVPVSIGGRNFPKSRGHTGSSAIAAVSSRLSRHAKGSRKRSKSQHLHATSSNISSVKSEVPHQLDVLLDKAPVDVEIQKKHGWNSEDKSDNLFVKNEGLTVHRHPVAQSSDACRGKVAYTRGLHVWDISWDVRQRGTHAIIGVCTKEAPLTCLGYRSLVGSTDQSWGWDLGRNKLYHSGKSSKHRKIYAESGSTGQTLSVPKKVRVILDMEAGTLSFMVNGKYHGVAFSGLKGKTLYPIVSCVWGNCEIRMTYINGSKPAPLSLSELSRHAIRTSMGGKITRERTSKLPIPPLMQSYVANRNYRLPANMFTLPPPPSICFDMPSSLIESTPELSSTA